MLYILQQIASYRSKKYTRQFILEISSSITEEHRMVNVKVKIRDLREDKSHKLLYYKTYYLLLHVLNPFLPSFRYCSRYFLFSAWLSKH